MKKKLSQPELVAAALMGDVFQSELCGWSYDSPEAIREMIEGGQNWACHDYTRGLCEKKKSCGEFSPAAGKKLFGECRKVRVVTTLTMQDVKSAH